MSSGRLIIPNSEPIYTSAGVPASGATLTVYLTGTTTLATIYTSQAMTTPMLNPQTSNASGLFYDQSTEIWADASIAYDVYLNAGNGQSWTYNNVWLLGEPASISGYAPINSPTFTGTPQAPTPAANDSSSKIATTQFVQGLVAAASVIPSGLMMVAPFQGGLSGWLVCDGAAVSRTTYARLFGVIGTTWGAGDGTTTFNLPQTGGQFLRGWTSTQTVDTGRTFASTQTDAFQGHRHTPLGTSTGGLQYGFNVWSTSTGNNHGAPTGSGSTTEVTTGNAVTDTGNGVPRTASETRPTNISVQWLIKT